MARIGGVKVSDGGTIYWGTFLSVLIGAPAGAYYLGIVRTLRGWTRGVGDAAAGARETVESFIFTLFGGVSGALNTAQDQFAASVSTTVRLDVPQGIARAFPGLVSEPAGGVVQLHLGPATFAVGVAVSLAGTWAFFKGVQAARGGLIG